MIGLRIARIQPPHHGHLDAIQQAFDHGLKKLIIGIGSSDKSHSPDNPFSVQERQYMIELLLQENGLASQTDIYHIPDFSDDTQRTQHILQTIPTFSHIISDNPRVNDQFNDKTIIQPKNNLPIRASDIRQAIITKQDDIIQQYLTKDIIDYLNQIDAYKRITENQH